MANRKRNPVPASKWAKIKYAVDLFQRFRGHDPKYIDTYEVPQHDVLMLIGNLDGVLYTTIRDGKTEKYIHKFKRSSRPLLCCSHDGKALYIVGGQYDFTEVGITDR